MFLTVINCTSKIVRTKMKEVNKQARAFRVEIRLTEQENEILRRHAEKHGMTVSQVLRSLIPLCESGIKLPDSGSCREGDREI
jgi:hypothetical protein